MLKQLLVLLVCLSLCACAVTRSYQPANAELGGLSKGQPVELVFRSGNKVKTKFQRLDDNGIVTDAGEFPVDDVRTIKVREKNTGGTVLLVIAVVLGVWAIAARKVGEALACGSAQEAGGECS